MKNNLYDWFAKKLFLVNKIDSQLLLLLTTRINTLFIDTERPSVHQCDGPETTNGVIVTSSSTAYVDWEVSLSLSQSGKKISQPQSRQYIIQG